MNQPPLSDDRFDRAINHADLDTLTKAVDSLCLDERFDEVVALRHRCRAALTRGLQLWPIAAYCDYRLALDAPDARALTGLGELSERFMLGPLAEVLASTHTFSSLSDSLPTSPDSAAFAQECVARGEDLTSDSSALRLPDVLGLPLKLFGWEPAYAVADYRPDRVRCDPPKPPSNWNRSALSGGERLVDRAVDGALRDLVAPWLVSSNGRVDVTSVEGTAEHAVGVLGLRSASFAEINVSQAMAFMAWAASTGGANGRRRGTATGRMRAWWALRALTGSDEDDLDPDELAQAAMELRYFLWNDGSPDTGWALRLAIEDVDDGLAWAIAAVDAA